MYMRIELLPGFDVNTSASNLLYDYDPSSGGSSFNNASSNPTDLILDPFCGCGTAIAVSQKTGKEMDWN